ncbi:MAG TPA: ATP-binding protein [Pyrinomonadaceae bacterium]|nr:ATP-binding protein [Pyrinomonadaceae bacterium]
MLTPPAALSGEELSERVEALRRVGVFADLPDEQLRWFVGRAVERRLAPGEVLSRRGDPPEWMAVYLEGEVHGVRDDEMSDGFVYIARAGDPATEVSGMLPYSRMKELPSTSRAVAPTRLLLMHVRHFPEMLERMPVLARRLVGVMSDRVREVTKLDVQQDKLMALGKLSAGLAHELNNPAAAARRAADELLGALDEMRAADLRLCRHSLSAEQRELITRFEHDSIKGQADAPPLDALAQSDREEELTSWMDEHGGDDGWRFAPVLVEAGVGVESLDELRRGVGPAAFGDVLTRVAAQLQTARLVSDIKAGTTRISELVGAIKEYSYMDMAPLQEVDLHRGLDNTLLILKHKLKRKNVEVVRDYAEDLPLVTVFGSELNQVWTNLIDNAIDALPEAGGRLKVRTKREPTHVLVEVRDNGPGIPEDVRPHLFEPFFTTKPVGEGTGLGLDTALRVVRKHKGNIRFETKPGDTCFQVRLPFTQAGEERL